MKSSVINIYEKLSIIPITLLIFAGIYEMCVGNIVRGIMNGNVSWMIPVTKSLIIDTVITLITVYCLINGMPKQYKKLRDNSKTKGFSLFLLLAGVFIAIILFIIGKLYLGQVVFKINYILFMVILLILCILQKVFDNIIYQKKNVNNV